MSGCDVEGNDACGRLFVFWLVMSAPVARPIPKMTMAHWRRTILTQQDACHAGNGCGPSLAVVSSSSVEYLEPLCDLVPATVSDGVACGTGPGATCSGAPAGAIRQFRREDAFS